MLWLFLGKCCYTSGRVFGSSLSLLSLQSNFRLQFNKPWVCAWQEDPKILCVVRSRFAFCFWCSYYYRSSFNLARCNVSLYNNRLHVVKLLLLLRKVSLCWEKTSSKKSSARGSSFYAKDWCQQIRNMDASIALDDSFHSLGFTVGQSCCAKF